MNEDTTLEAHRADIPLQALPPLPRCPLRLILDNVRSAHNTGAAFRTADAAAVELLYLVGMTPHPPHSQVEKTALGGTRYVPWKYRTEFAEVEKDLLAEEYALVALDNGPGSVELWDFAWPDKPALVVGNEVDGVSESALSVCRHRVSLPMFGYKRSLNVTTALGIALYEYRRKLTTPENEKSILLENEGS